MMMVGRYSANHLAIIALTTLSGILLIALIVSLASSGAAASGTSTGSCIGQFVESLPSSGAATTDDEVAEFLQLPACSKLTPDQQHQVLMELTDFETKIGAVKA